MTEKPNHLRFIMKHTVQKPHPPFSSQCGQFIVHQVPAAQDNLIWLIEYQKGRVAAVDGPSAKEVLMYCTKHALSLDTIINTHTHGDHIGINKDLKRKGLLKNMRVIGAQVRCDDIPGITDPVQDGDRIILGSFSGIAMRTDGHIDGHISYVFSDVLFCGDTLFTGGCGYLFDGPPKAMFQSLNRLRSLPPETKVCCAHEYTIDNLRFACSVEPNNTILLERYTKGKQIRENGGTLVPSTIALECATNPFLRWEQKEIIESLHTQLRNATLSTPADIFAATRQCKDSKSYRK
jgi:hydroxyacylglutathione hydrolase